MMTRFMLTHESQGKAAEKRGQCSLEKDLVEKMQAGSAATDDDMDGGFEALGYMSPHDHFTLDRVSR